MNKEYSKNKYYKDDEIKKAEELATGFYGRLYTPQLFRSGNKKLGSNVAIFDLPSIITCKYQCNGCYALKAERLYRNTRLHRAFHYEIVKQALEDNNKREYLINYINVELRRHAILYSLPVVRIHSSGDMFSTKYLELWLDIIRFNKDIKFYTYTKQLDNKIIDELNNDFDNFNIVKSIVDDKYINFGDLEYLEDVSKVLEAKGEQYHICGYGHSDNKLECMGNCTQCLHCSNVLFVKH